MGVMAKDGLVVSDSPAFIHVHVHVMKGLKLASKLAQGLVST